MQRVSLAFGGERNTTATISRGLGRGLGAGRAALTLALFVAALAPLALAQTPAPPEATEGEAQALARIGNIELDRKARSFRVPGTVARVEPPLEYLAVARGGMKAYESLLELDAGGTELNTACILIGLETPGGGMPQFQFDQQPIEGQRVGLSIGWEGDAGPIEVAAGRLLTVKGKEAGEQPWVYLGSMNAPDGRYLAEDSGTVIGFVHDPISVIEHRDGLGIGAYGSIAGNAELAPPVGSRVWLRVTNLDAAGADKGSD